MGSRCLEGRTLTCEASSFNKYGSVACKICINRVHYFMVVGVHARLQGSAIEVLCAVVTISDSWSCDTFVVSVFVGDMRFFHPNSSPVGRLAW